MGFQQWCHTCLWSCQHKTTSTPQWPPNHSAELRYCELFGSYQSDHYWLFLFQALNSCGDLSKGWRNQLHLGIVPECGHLRLRVTAALTSTGAFSPRWWANWAMVLGWTACGLKRPAECHPLEAVFFLRKYRPSELPVPMILLTWGSLLI